MMCPMEQVSTMMELDNLRNWIRACATITTVTTVVMTTIFSNRPLTDPPSEIG